MKGKTNIDLGEPKGAFVGAGSSDLSGTPKRKSDGGKHRVKNPPNFHASGDSTATSISAARKPTHWRRGGFVNVK